MTILTLTNVLPVPGVSQQDPTAPDQNDCFAACGKMKLTPYKLGVGVTVHDIYVLSGGTGKGLWLNQVKSALSQLGLETEGVSGFTIDKVLSTLFQLKSISAIVHYGRLVSSGYTQYMNFNDAHVMEIVGAGFSIINGMPVKVFAVNDPYTFGRLFPTIIDANDFMMAWGEAILDNNTPFTGLVAVDGICDKSVHTTVAGIYVIGPMVANAIRIRKGPTSNSADMGLIWKTSGLTISIKEVVPNPAKPSELWGKLTDGRGYVFMEYLVKVG